MAHTEIVYWALFVFSLIIVLGLLVWDPIVIRYRDWKLKRAFRLRSAASKGMLKRSFFFFL
ncbi:hypothetical protein [Desulfomonile tiedjei]|uniref:Uncharacterized protein n=1 Tax=Desulfomonile tiedjei (strain ATCC 49306 / DSM 6799 / DCB-1) TaxID=706587 RepID=I4CF52_DESTA|nr:hypothetical protein [Desulfomonile tiedjei]AFM28193.1 hypothetical protein Desti_5613 [Desulfomonile tiedjei DSM 6799]